jgi:lipid-A-disaccharide synthase
MKVFIIAGEASGDLHGSNLIKAFKAHDPQIELAFWGGDKMAEAAGLTPLKHINELAFMGFLEVVTHLSAIRKNFKNCKNHIRDFAPDAIIFIDYPGFNLRLAPFAKSLDIKTFYYISPKVWAWKKNRVYSIKKYIDRLYSILPFEVDFYQKYQYPIHYVGNPLMDALESFTQKQTTAPCAEHIVLLPGSRQQEIERMLPIMIQTAKGFPNKKFVIAGAPGFTPEFYQKWMENTSYPILFNQSYDLLWKAEAALVTSGTATLETALLQVPQVVCYRANSVSYHLAKYLVNIQFISLVNLIMQRKVVTELIQDELTVANLEKELKLLIYAGSNRASQLADYQILQEKVGSSGASQRVADDILKYLS